MMWLQFSQTFQLYIQKKFLQFASRYFISKSFTCESKPHQKTLLHFITINYRPYDFHDITVQCTGYGLLQFGGQFSKNLQQVNLRIITNVECANHDSGISATQLCTYGSDGKDSCQFDSGGPLFYQSNDGRMFSLGIVSLGEGCGMAKPAVNTRMTSYTDWIESVTGPLCQLVIKF